MLGVDALRLLTDSVDISPQSLRGLGAEPASAGSCVFGGYQDGGLRIVPWSSCSTEVEIECELGEPTRTEIRTEEAHRRAVSEWMARGV